MILLSILLAAGQVTPVRPIVKGTGLPPAALTEDSGVMVPIDAMFAALAARDGRAILAQVRADGGATKVEERADGGRYVTRMSWAEFAATLKPGPERYAERLTDPAIDVDGDIAMVWSPYVFTIDGKVAHCGTDHFDMVREGGRWRIPERDVVAAHHRMRWLTCRNSYHHFARLPRSPSLDWPGR